MVTLKHKTSNVDLSGFAKISWRSKQVGLRELRIAEVVQMDMHLKNGKVEFYRTKLKVSFKYEG